MPSLRQLQAFRAVMQTGSISRAAELMLLTQPAVTKLIQSLEAESGLSLFIRHNRRLLPTAEARHYLFEAENLFENLARLRRVAQDLKSMVFTNLTVGSYTAFAIGLMPRLLNDFQKRNERTTTTLMINSSRRVCDLAIAQQFDIGFSLLPVHHQDVISIACLREPMVAVMPPDHRLADREVVHVSDFDGEPFVSMGFDDGQSTLVDEYFEQAGSKPQIVARVTLSSAVCEFVREGAGVSVISSLSARAAALTGVHHARLEPPLHTVTHLLLPKRRPLSGIRDRFLTYMFECLQADPGRMEILDDTYGANGE